MTPKYTDTMTPNGTDTVTQMAQTQMNPNDTGTNDPKSHRHKLWHVLCADFNLEYVYILACVMCRFDACTCYMHYC